MKNIRKSTFVGVLVALITSIAVYQGIFAWYWYANTIVDSSSCFVHRFVVEDSKFAIFKRDVAKAMQQNKLPLTLDRPEKIEWFNDISSLTLYSSELAGNKERNLFICSMDQKYTEWQKITTDIEAVMPKTIEHKFAELQLDSRVYGYPAKTDVNGNQRETIFVNMSLPITPESLRHALHDALPAKQ